MRVIDYKEEKQYQEMTTQKTYFWFIKFNKTYRRVGTKIYAFIYPDTYQRLSFSEYFEIQNMFHLYDNLNK